MEPIYIPRHRIDVHEMAKLTFSTTLRRFIIVAVFKGIVAGSLCYFILQFLDEMGIRAAIGIGAGVLAAALSLAVAPAQLAKLYSKPNQAIAFSDRTLVIEETGLRVEYTVGMLSFFPWRVFIRVRWLSKFLLLYITDYQYITIPRQLLGERTEEIMRGLLGKAQGTTAATGPSGAL